MSDAQAAATLVDEHYGAMHRLARLLVADPDTARDAVRAAWLKALANEDGDGDGAASGTTRRGRLLGLVLRELPPSPPSGAGGPAAHRDELEPDDSRWAGWWRDELPDTPPAARETLEAALASLPAAVGAMVVLRDVEGLDAAEVEALLGHSAERQLALLHHGRSAVRNALRGLA